MLAEGPQELLHASVARLVEPKEVSHANKGTSGGLAWFNHVRPPEVPLLSHKSSGGSTGSGSIECESS